MAYSVNSYFEDFMRDSVNLNPERTTTARANLDWLVHKIEDLANNGRIPPLYNGANHIFFASFARNTKIRPLDDIELCESLKSFFDINLEKLKKNHRSINERVLYRVQDRIYIHRKTAFKIPD